LSFLIALILPSAEIEIITEKKMIESVVNINFIKTDKSLEESIEKMKNHGNNFHLYPIEVRFEDEIDFPVISKIFEGQNAFGDIILYNNYPDPITIRNKTKFQTKDGLIFLSKHYVRIPGIQRVENEKGEISVQPGQALVNLIASEVDVYQEIIGSRGNIDPQKFSIPGLTSYMQKFVWGENKKAFRGGTTRWRRAVQQYDIDAARDKLNNILYTKSKEKILEFINQHNSINPTKLTLFPIEKYIIAEVSKVEFPEEIIGQNIQQFHVKGEMLVKAYVFTKEDFYEFMVSHIEKKKDPKMKIEKFEFEAMTFRNFEETPLEIRIATSMQGRQSYKIDSESEEGKEFQGRVKKHLRGMRKDEALKFLRNQKEINQVKIKVWPPMKKHMPLVTNNIVIVEK
jgi:hypothetical protein